MKLAVRRPSIAATESIGMTRSLELAIPPSASGTFPTFSAAMGSGAAGLSTSSLTLPWEMRSSSAVSLVTLVTLVALVALVALAVFRFLGWEPAVLSVGSSSVMSMELAPTDLEAALGRFFVSAGLAAPAVLGVLVSSSLPISDD